jgi:hypothetical protein
MCIAHVIGRFRRSIRSGGASWKIGPNNLHQYFFMVCAPINPPSRGDAPGPSTSSDEGWPLGCGPIFMDSRDLWRGTRMNTMKTMNTTHKSKANTHTQDTHRLSSLARFTNSIESQGRDSKSRIPYERLIFCRSRIPLGEETKSMDRITHKSMQEIHYKVEFPK